MTAPAWRDEMLALLEALLPAGWSDAVAAGDTVTVFTLRGQLDGAEIVRELGRAGWIAPHWEPAHGGRGLSIDVAQAIASLLDDWEVPRIPRGSGFVLAAPTILEWSGAETKRRFLPPIATGEERWCQLFSEPGAGSDHQ